MKSTSFRSLTLFSKFFLEKYYILDTLLLFHTTFNTNDKNCAEYIFLFIYKYVFFTSTILSIIYYKILERCLGSIIVLQFNKYKRRLVRRTPMVSI